MTKEEQEEKLDQQLIAARKTINVINRFLSYVVGGAIFGTLFLWPIISRYSPNLYPYDWNSVLFFFALCKKAFTVFIGSGAIISVIIAIIGMSSAEKMKTVLSSLLLLVLIFATALFVMEVHLKLSKSLTTINYYVKQYPESAFTHYLRGEYFLARENYKDAISNYDEALEHDPESAYYYARRGYACYQDGQDEKAIEDYDEVIARNSKKGGFYRERGWVYSALKEYDEAIDDYNKAINLYSKDADDYIYRAEAYEARNATGDEELTKLDREKAAELEAKKKK